MKWLLALLLSVMSGAALAETTGAVNPGAPAQPSVNDEVPPGGCMPIGLTTSGEIVFPIQCKGFIERHRGAAVEQKPTLEQKPAAVEQKPAVVEEKPSAAEQKPAAVEQKPAVVEEKPAAVEEKPTAAEQKPATEQKAAAGQSESVAPEDSKPANKPVETAPLQKRVEHEPRQRSMRSDNCKSYRTYDPASGTYRGYDGQRRSCR
jgi:outer membrane biosynthesis protein TonB